MMQNVKKGEVMDDIKNHRTEKKVGELLTKSLEDIRNQYKGSDDNTEQLIFSADEIFEDYKKEYEKSLEIIIPNVIPIGSEVMTSARLMNILDHGKALIGAEFDSKLMGQFKTSVDDEQIVVAVGQDCRYLKVGDRVKIRLKDFTRRMNPNTINSQEVTEIPLEIIDDVKYLSISERNVKYIIKPTSN